MTQSGREQVPFQRWKACQTLCRPFLRAPNKTFFLMCD